MKDFLEANGSEVENMLFQEFDLDKAIEISKEEARAKGRAEGRAEGKAEGKAEEIKELIKKSLRKGRTLEEISDFLDIEIEKVTEIAKSIKK